MPTRRRQRRVPQDLRVVVRVDVDEPRRDDAARRVDLARRGHAVADLDDPAVGDTDVGAPRRRPGPVDDRTSTNGDLRVHCAP